MRTCTCVCVAVSTETIFDLRNFPFAEIRHFLFLAKHVSCIDMHHFDWLPRKLMMSLMFMFSCHGSFEHCCSAILPEELYVCRDEWMKRKGFCHTVFNPLSAKPSFQLWYPGGQRLKVISFSWSGVKSPSKCFSNTEPTTIIASRDEKRC